MTMTKAPSNMQVTPDTLEQRDAEARPAGKPPKATDELTAVAIEPGSALAVRRA